jgi:hypothetical protein
MTVSDKNMFGTRERRRDLVDMSSQVLSGSTPLDHSIQPGPIKGLDP